MSAGGAGRSEAAGWLLAAGLLAVITFGYVMRSTAYFTAAPGDLGDARYNSIVLEHLYLSVTRGARLWSPAFFFPFEGVLAFSDNHLGSGAVYVAARLLGMPREQAFDAWFAVGTLLNFACCLYAIRRLGLSTAAAAVGASLFTFSLPVLAQDNHAQFVYRFASPLAVLALWQAFERRRLTDLARAAFFTVWQFYCTIYLGVFLVYLLAALTAALLFLRRPFEWPRWRAGWTAEPSASRHAAIATLLASLIALAYLAGRYASTSRTYNLWRRVEEISDMLPRASSYLLADLTPLWSWLGSGISVPARWEHQLFIGAGALALAIAGFAARRDAPVRGLAQSMAGALLMLVCGTLWISGVSAYHLIAWLPGIEGLRAVTRIILIMLLPVSVLAALGADAILQRAGRRTAAAIPLLLALAALVVVEPLTATPYTTAFAKWRERLEAVKAALPPALPKDAILAVRSDSGDKQEQVLVEIDAMLLGQELGYPVLNGYSGYVPMGYRFERCASTKERLWGYLLFTEGRVKPSVYSPRLVVIDLGRCPPSL